MTLTKAQTDLAILDIATQVSDALLVSEAGLRDIVRIVLEHAAMDAAARRQRKRECMARVEAAEADAALRCEAAAATRREVASLFAESLKTALPPEPVAKQHASR